MKREFVIKMISRGEIQIEGRVFIFAASRKKAREKFQKMYPRYKIIFLKEFSGDYTKDN